MLHGFSSVFDSLAHAGAATWAMIVCLLTAFTTVGTSIKLYYEICKLKAEARARVDKALEEKRLVRVPTPDELDSAIREFTAYANIREYLRPRRNDTVLKMEIRQATFQSEIYDVVRYGATVRRPIRPRVIMNWTHALMGCVIVFVIVCVAYLLLLQI